MQTINTKKTTRRQRQKQRRRRQQQLDRKLDKINHLGPSGRGLDSLASVGGSGGFPRDGGEDLAGETGLGGGGLLVLRALLRDRWLAQRLA